MLVAITSSRKIAAIQRALEDRLAHELDLREGPFKIGFQGGDVQVDSISVSPIFWAAHRRDDESKINKFWNAFGLTKDFRESISNTITVEVNIPTEGFDGRVAGLFARDTASKRTLLLHSGKIGGGKKDVGKSKFLDACKSRQAQVRIGDDTQRSETYLIVADLSTSLLVDQLAEFVAEVSAFKARIRDQELERLSDRELERRARKAPKHPKPQQAISTVFGRDPNVATWVKRRAKGLCELCENFAPFLDPNGNPFLESHHIKWLSRGGEDSIENAVALCPNCHRKMHSLNNEHDIAKLRRKADKKQNG